MMMITPLQPKLSELGVVRRSILKLITKVQKILLRSERKLITNLYYTLARIHFSIYFSGKLSLDQEVMNNTEAGYRAMRRHSILVVNTLFKTSADMRKKIIRNAAQESFKKNILLNAKL